MLRVDDGDEFEAAWTGGTISDQERTSALAAVEDLHGLFGASRPQLDETGWRRLADATALALPPLRYLP